MEFLLANKIFENESTENFKNGCPDKMEKTYYIIEEESFEETPLKIIKN